MVLCIVLQARAPRADKARGFGGRAGWNEVHLQAQLRRGQVGTAMLQDAKLQSVLHLAPSVHDTLPLPDMGHTSKHGAPAARAYSTLRGRLSHG